MRKITSILYIFILLISLGANGQSKKSQTTKTQKFLAYGPKTSQKIKELFFNKNGCKLPENISSINSIAKYTNFESIEGAGNIYTWDFSNGFQISAISETGGIAGAKDKIALISFNYGNLDTLNLYENISINKSTLSTIQSLYKNKLIKFKKASSPTYKIKNGNFYTTFYFNNKNILSSISISNYDLEL